MAVLTVYADKPHLPTPALLEPDRYGFSITPPRTPGVTLITPTGDRHEAFRLCETWIKQQAYRGPLQWIVVDDGQVPTHCTMGQHYIRREPQQDDPAHTLCRNMLAAIPHIEHEQFLIIEDDDYYSPDYIEQMLEWLNQADLVGEVGAKYYYLGSRRYHQFREHRHASWCRTGFHKSVLPTVQEQASATDHQSLDLRVWKAWEGTRFRWVDQTGTRGLCVGIKGVPGRQGVTWHTPRISHPDPDGEQLQKWLGPDAKQYDSLIAEAVAKPSCHVVVYTAIFGDYDDLTTDMEFTPAVRYVCFTDRDDLPDSTPWEIRHVDRRHQSPRVENRSYKMLAHKLFPDADYTIYIDGNHALTQDPFDVITDCEQFDINKYGEPNQAQLFCLSVKHRDCIYQEADWIVAERKDDAVIVGQQIARYREEGFPEHAGLALGGFLVRKHDCGQFNEMWWREYLQGSTRDQLSFPYVLRKSGIKHVIMDVDNSRFIRRVQKHNTPYQIG